MYCYILFISFFISMRSIEAKTFVRYPEPFQSSFVKASHKCLDELKIDPDIVKMGHDTEYMAKSEDMKNLFYCTMTDGGISYETGHIDLKKTAEYFPKNVHEVIAECDKENGKDAAETAIKIGICFHKNSPVHYSMYPM